MQANGSLRVSPNSRPIRLVGGGYVRRGSAGVAQLVEHLFCKQVVRGSSPLASSISSSSLRGDSMPAISSLSEGCPSGQREQAVNLPAHAYVGSNPTPSTRSVVSSRVRWRSSRPTTGKELLPVAEVTGSYAIAGVAQLVERQPSKLNVVGSNPISRSPISSTALGSSLVGMSDQAARGLQHASGVQRSAPLGFPLPT
jgi:hypothetical protein